VGELPAETRLGAIRLRAGDAGLLRDFYERVIGLRGVAAGNGVTALGAGDVPLVELLSAPDAPARPPATTGLFHLALLVPTRADLSRALRRVFDGGAALHGDHGSAHGPIFAAPAVRGVVQWGAASDSRMLLTTPQRATTAHLSR